MTGFKSKKAAALDKLDRRGSIALARSLCYQINGAADDSDDMDGGGYGSVDIAEILSAEVVRLQAALAQPAQEPVADALIRQYITALVANKPDEAANATKAMVDYVYTTQPQEKNA
jgi:hypothetical protein